MNSSFTLAKAGADSSANGFYYFRMHKLRVLSNYPLVLESIVNAALLEPPVDLSQSASSCGTLRTIDVNTFWVDHDRHNHTAYFHDTEPIIDIVDASDCRQHRALQVVEMERLSGRPVSMISTAFNWRNVIHRRNW
jgi:hypothetical protein